jgi:hypothetical protein
MGQRTPEEIRQAAKPGVLCLLIHPDKPGLVKIGLTYGTPEQCYTENVWGSLKRSTQNSSAINKPPADYPI